MASPFITWGEIEDAPVKLAEAKNFKIRESSDREKLASSMASNIPKTKAIQKKANQEIFKKALNSGTPHKVATILSCSHGNSLVQQILSRKLTGSKAGVNSSKTPFMNKISNQTPSNASNIKPTRINRPTNSLTVPSSSSQNSQQTNKQAVEDDTPLLKF